MITRTRLVIIFVVAAAVLGLCAAIIASALAVPEGSPTVQTQDVKPGKVGSGLDLPIVQLEGNWESEPDNNGNQFVANVADSTIDIDMTNTNVNMTYWHGTFEPTASAGKTLTSNHVEIDKMVMSSAASKDFVIGEDSVTFEMTAMGVTRTVVLRRA